MTQDTRKDKRAKIVSLNVRYKSATVDEFIENHSYDVSKGGIFIKTPTPFPPGTLIKFEIRIAGDKAVIAGVGRVVWKREAGTASAERPAGMGVKFIKIDESSRQVIDRVVAEKGDAGAFASEQEGDMANEPAASPFEGNVAPQPVATAERPPRPAGKSTIIGIGTSAPPPAMANELPKAPAAGSAMFPTTNSEADMPPKQERTVMKQAAALLEEALKEAGGSMEDIGTNPLFDAAHAGRDIGKSTLVGMPVPKPSSAPRIETGAPKTTSAPRIETGAPKTQSTPPEALKREAGAAAAVAKTSPPETTRESPSAKGPSAKGSAAVEADDGSPTSRQRKTDPPAVRKRSATAIVESEPPPRKKGGVNPLVWVGLVVVLGGGIAFLYKDKLIDSSDATTTATATPTTPLAVPPPPPAVPTASAAASSETTGAALTTDAAIATTDAASATTGSGADAGVATKDAGTAAAALGTSATSATAAPVVAPAPTPTPVVTATPAPPKPVVTAAPAPTPKPPAPTPKPKPAATDDDNPY